MKTWWNKYRAWEQGLTRKQKIVIFCGIVFFSVAKDMFNERNTLLYKEGYCHGSMGLRDIKFSSSYMEGYNDGVKDISFYNEGKEDGRKQLRPLYRDNYNYMRGYNECY